MVPATMVILQRKRCGVSVDSINSRLFHLINCVISKQVMETVVSPFPHLSNEDNYLIGLL